MLEHLSRFTKIEKTGKTGKGERVVAASDQKFVDDLVDSNKEKEHLSEEDSDLLKHVLVDIVSGYLRDQKNVNEIRSKLENDFELAIIDLRDLLKKIKFSNGGVEKNAKLVARIMKDDFDLVGDMDAGEAEEHELHEQEHQFDDKLAALMRMKRKHKRFVELLEDMLDEEDRLLSLAPKGGEEAYLKRFRDLYQLVLKAPQTVEEWRASPERKELCSKYLFPFAHQFLKNKDA